jgi:CHAT domain-containing protein/Tfp pilus assembly protein PilF
MKKSVKLMVSLFQQADLFSACRPCKLHLVFVFLLTFHNIVSGSPAKSLNQPCTYSKSQQTGEPYLVNDDLLQAQISDSIEQLILKSEQLWFEDKKQAESLAFSLFNALENTQVSDSLRARMYHLIGKILVDKQQLNAGIDSLNIALNIMKNIYGDNDTSLANTYNYLGIAHLYMRQYGKAMAYFEQTVRILNKNNVVNWTLYDANMNMGIVNGTKSRFDQSYKYFNQAKLIIDSIGTASDSILLAKLYINYGLMSTLMGKFEEANHYYSIAETVFKRELGDDNLSVANVMINKGINAYYKYDFVKAELYYKEVINIYLKRDKTSIVISKSYNNLSALSLKTGDFASSIRYGLTGLKYNPDNYLKVLFYQNLADAYASLGKADKAEHYYLEAINLLQTTRADPTKSISLYKSYADFLFNEKKFEKSKTYYFIALKKIDAYQRSDSKVYASLLSQIGDFYRYSENNLDSAFIFYNQSISSWNDILAKQDTSKSGNFNDIRFLDAYLGKARSQSFLYQQSSNLDLLKEGISIYRLALNWAEKISGNLDTENQLLLNEKFKIAYEEAIDIAYILYKETGDIQYRDLAFEYGERLKSSVLLAAVQNINALRTTDVPEQIVQSEIQLQQEVNGMKRLLIEEQVKAHPSAKKTDFFNSRLLKLMLSYDSLVAKIEQEYPKYYALKYDHSVISVTDLTEQLQADEVVLEYVLTDSTLTLFSFGKEIRHFSQIKIDTLFHDALDYLVNIKNIDVPQSGKNEMIRFIRNANTLWNYLIEPVYHQLKDKKLIIVPDGRLGYLPFDLLLNSALIPDELNYGLLPYLFKAFPISYSYSSTLRFNKYFRRKNEQAHKLIAFAPDYKSGKKTQNPSLSPLPNSAREVIEVSQIFDGKAYLEEDATKSKFMKDAEKYKVIHLAMHTIINDSLPMLSELLFYRDSVLSPDNTLHTYEVFGLKLSADLVVLSACNTGYGRLQKGEGIMSLARGFKYAGVPSIVFTLWEVQDKATSGIMEGFYTFLKAGDRKDVALQKAKVNFLAHANQLKSHPYYWSSFLLTGDTGQIIHKQEESTSGRLIVFGILLLTLLWFAVVYWKKKSEK